MRATIGSHKRSIARGWAALISNRIGDGKERNERLLIVNAKLQ